MLCNTNVTCEMSHMDKEINYIYICIFMVSIQMCINVLYNNQLLYIVLVSVINK